MSNSKETNISSGYDNMVFIPDQTLRRIIADGKNGNFFAVLCLHPTSIFQDVGRNYRSLSRFVHPDRNESQLASEAFDALSRAYQVLSVKEKFTAEQQRRLQCFIRPNHTEASMKHNAIVLASRQSAPEDYRRMLAFSNGGFFSGHTMFEPAEKRAHPATQEMRPAKTRKIVTILDPSPKHH